jgi:hypothetical protein
MIYDFTLIVVGMDSADDDRLDAAARFHDCTISSSKGVVRIEFDRDAPTLDQAIGSAIRDLKSIGIPAYLEMIQDADGNPIEEKALRSA